MLAPLPEVMAEAIKPRALDPHTDVEYPEEIESSKNESEELEGDGESEVLNPLSLNIFPQSYATRKLKQTDHPEINFVPTPIQPVSNNSPYTFREAHLPRRISHCKYTVFPISDLHPPSTYFNCQSNSILETNNSSLDFPSNRRPQKRESSKPSTENILAWMNTYGIKIELLSRGSSEYLKLARLLFPYKHLNAEKLEDIPATDLYQHQARLVPGIRPWDATKKGKKRYSPDK
ncbi:hypothetical protein GcM1_238071 [Golovinomyces cichoracearum]|uniref:Uncharacterized protein n=1 Tax=Golovinomyces cichoracearum TaxID=62708 RepID=A0A420IJB2_9PEZI|nr:hypothetical protein GcM1_238071 [Golovinomyces cichoracearum]